MPLPCPHCDLDMYHEAYELYLCMFGPVFEMGCPWCNRVVTIEVNASGEFRADKIRARVL